ncbi:MAG: HAD hydrolase-like protein [bacterium]
MKYLILFDIDGTILKFKQYNSREIFAKMLKEVFGKDVPLSVMPDFSGMTDLQILKDIAKKIQLDNDELFSKLPIVWSTICNDFKQYCTPEYIQLLPKAKYLITILNSNSHIYLGLQTGNFVDNAYIKLQAFDLAQYFPFGAFGSDHEDRNQLPPLAISRANEYIGHNAFSAMNTLVIGDSHRDIECAKSNNLPVLAVATGNFSADELAVHQPDAILDNFANIEKTLSTINKLLRIR